MPARNTRFRALDEGFRRHLDRGGAWPLTKWYRDALKDKGGGRKDDLTRMKNGGAVAEKYVVALVELLRDGPALDAYLAARGADPRGLDVDRIVDLVAGPVRPVAAPAGGGVDWFARGLDGVVGLFTGFAHGQLVRPGTFCRDEDDVRAAVTLILTTVGRQLRRGGAGLPDAKAIELAEARMQLDRESYADRAVGLWRRSPWTIVYAVVDRVRVGCTLVLPLGESVYEELRTGRRTSHDCTAPDLALPSRALFIEAVGERPESECPATAKASAQLVRMMFLQVARMSLDPDGPPTGEERPLRIMSLAGTPKGEARIRRFGYRPLGVTMPGFDVELFEMEESRTWFVPLVLGYLQRRLAEARPVP